MKRIGLVLGISSLFLYGLPACNSQPEDSVDQAEETNEQKDDSMPGFVDQGDADFAVQAANGGMAEVELSKLAEERAASQEVKDFANRMIKDHGMANEKLKTLAAAKEITLPDSMSGEYQEHKEDLMAKSGNAFDKAYIDQMVNDHQKTVNLFERAAGSVRDPELNRFAQETLPTLRSHLRMCEELKARLK